MLAKVVVPSLGQFECYDQVSKRESVDTYHNTYTNWWFLAVVVLGVLCYTVGLSLLTVKLYMCYLKMPRRVDTSQGVGTDLIRVTPYWDMDLAQLRNEAGRRGFLGTTNLTKKFLVRWLVEDDYPWLRCW